MTRSYAILGTGALGGYYGARLAHAGFDVHFLLHSDYSHVKEYGLIVHSSDGDFSIAKPRVYARAEDMPACDVVVVALKTTQNHLLGELLPPAPGSSVVLCLQNGLDVERDIAAIVGDGRVIGGLCFLCSNKVGPGHIEHSDYGWVRFGEHGRIGITERLKSIAGDFARAGIKTELSEDLVAARWHKLVWNIPYNGLSVVLNATTDQLMACPATRELVEQLMHEVVAGAKACGKTISPNFVQQMLDDTVKMKPYRTSMKVDADEGRPMEIETMFGNPLRAARERGVELVRIAALYAQLRFMGGRAIGSEG
ncbi:MAG: putative 2-dehydropantoate 2-reductase [Phycisphaerales bacterium]